MIGLIIIYNLYVTEYWTLHIKDLIILINTVNQSIVINKLMVDILKGLHLRRFYKIKILAILMKKSKEWVHFILLRPKKLTEITKLLKKF